MKLKAENRLLSGGKILCAVSGGADSMCLMHLLWSSGADIAAAHYEHGIRGEESRRDAEFVESFCRERGIECVTGHGDVPAYASAHSMGIEEAARLLRYGFLEDAAKKLGCRYIATAHNADDNAETVLFNLTRGTGTAGLRGIPEERENIIRPLLRYSRADIEAYNTENAVPHVEDSSNLTDDYSRNLIRHRVMPVLREINPHISAACARTSALLRRDEDCLEGMARDFLRAYRDGESVPTDRLNALHPAVSSRVIRLLAGRSLSAEQVEAVLDICRGTEQRRADVPGMRFVSQSGRLYAGAERTVPIGEYALSSGGSAYIPEAGLLVTATEESYSGEVYDLFKTLYLKYENIPSVSLTGRRPGDRMRPEGRHCTKSLKSLFLEKGLTSAQRDAAPVIRDEKGILAVYGIAVDERAIPLPGDRVIHIKFEKLQEKRKENAQGC